MKYLAFLFVLIVPLVSCSDHDIPVHTEQGTKHVEASKMLFGSDDPEEQKEGFEYLLTEYLEGSAYSAGKLGWAYQQGLGVPADLEKAKELYAFAANSGMTYWQFLLAHAYEKGYLGYPVDLEKSVYWLSYEPKVHVDIYECWVANYYRNGIFPSSPELQEEYEQKCKNANK